MMTDPYCQWYNVAQELQFLPVKVKGKAKAKDIQRDSWSKGIKWQLDGQKWSFLAPGLSVFR